MRNGVIAVLAGAGMAVFAATAFAAEPSEVGKVQAALDAWLAARAPIEKVTGIAAYISFGATGPAIEAFAGKVGRDPAPLLSLCRQALGIRAPRQIFVVDRIPRNSAGKPLRRELSRS